MANNPLALLLEGYGSSSEEEDAPLLITELTGGLTAGATTVPITGPTGGLTAGVTTEPVTVPIAGPTVD